jgi:hypothetical protein
MHAAATGNGCEMMLLMHEGEEEEDGKNLISSEHQRERQITGRN